jgi:hypothetical protein
MSRADAIYASRLSLRELFPGTLDAKAEDLIGEIVQHCNPPIRVVSESTWSVPERPRGTREVTATEPWPVPRTC